MHCALVLIGSPGRRNALYPCIVLIYPGLVNSRLRERARLRLARSRKREFTSPG
jgi:hypothetical protein